jgi:hypothetical protein
MGVAVSVPRPISLSLNEISISQQETLIIDSSAYAGNSNWLKKACESLSNNRKVKKVVYKLFLSAYKSFNISSVFAKSMKNRESIIIYGDSLQFFEDSQWVSHWSSLQIKVPAT